MGSIHDYTESSLQSSGLTVRNYRRREDQNGIIEIDYDVVDRTGGFGTGAAVGATTSVVGIVGGIALSLFFPPAAPVLLTGAALSPAVVVPGAGAVGAAIGKNEHHTKLFCSKSGEFLGESKNDAAKKLNEKGLKLCEQYEFGEGQDWFRNAYYTAVFSFGTTRMEYKNNWEATEIAAEAQALLERGNFRDAKKKFGDACNKAMLPELSDLFAKRRDEARASERNQEVKESRDAENDEEEDGSDEDGSDEDGSNEDGSDEDGPDEDGSDEDGSDEDGSDEDRSDEETHYKIFTSTSREFLGENKNAAAKKLNKKGLKLCKQYEFREAQDLFRNAYYKAEYDFGTTRKQYKNNWKATVIAAEAQDLLEEGNFPEAAEKFEEAFHKATLPKLYHLFAKRRDEAQTSELNQQAKGSREETSNSENDEEEDGSNEDESDEDGSDEDLSDAENHAYNAAVSAFGTRRMQYTNNSEATTTAALAEAGELFQKAKISREAAWDAEQDEEEDGSDEDESDEDGSDEDLSDAENHYKKFNSTSRELLDENKNDATQKQNWFHNAYNATVSAFDTMRMQYTNNSEATTTAAEAEAAELFQQAKISWEAAWDAEQDEEEDRSDEATRYYVHSNDLFQKASAILPDNKDYLNWVNISSLKLEGNSLFNQGLSLQKKANELMQRSLYTQALEKYQKALSKFQEGFRKSGDARFQACIDLVKECIDETTAAINSAATSRSRINAVTSNQTHQSHFVL